MFYWNRETLAEFIWLESVDSQPALPSSFLAAVFRWGMRCTCLSGVVEDQDAAVAERDLFGLPGGTLVEGLGLYAGGVSFLVKPVQVRIVVRDPFLDGLPGARWARYRRAAVAVWKRWRRLRKMPRRALGMVKRNCRCGTSWQTAVAIQLLVERTRRWWQEGQKWRPLQVKARRRSWPQSVHWSRVKPGAIDSDNQELISILTTENISSLRSTRRG